MTTDAVTRYLHQHIPLTAHMQVTVRAADDAGVRLAAPLAPNINHRQTAFGGSAAALATLACWTLLHVRLDNCGIVVRRSAMDYQTPIDADFEAFCPSPDAAVWDQFAEVLAHRGKGRIDLASEVLCRDIAAARFTGQFVALRREE